MRYVSTSTSYWTDPDVLKWDKAAKLLYRYLFENEHVHGTSGVGRMADSTIQHETGLDDKDMVQARAEIGDKVRWYEDGWYWVAARIKHTCRRANGQPNPTRVQAVLNYLPSLPEPIQKDILHRYPTRSLLVGHRYSMDGVSNSESEGKPNTLDPSTMGYGCSRDGVLAGSAVSVSVTDTDTDTETGTEAARRSGSAGAGVEKDDGQEQELASFAFRVFHHETVLLAEWLKQYPLAWIRAALEATEKAGKNKPTYTRAILRRWFEQGGLDKPADDERGGYTI